MMSRKRLYKIAAFVFGGASVLLSLTLTGEVYTDNLPFNTIVKCCSAFPLLLVALIMLIPLLHMVFLDGGGTYTAAESTEKANTSLEYSSVWLLALSALYFVFVNYFFSEELSELFVKNSRFVHYRSAPFWSSLLLLIASFFLVLHCRCKDKSKKIDMEEEARAIFKGDFGINLPK